MSVFRHLGISSCRYLHRSHMASLPVHDSCSNDRFRCRTSTQSSGPARASCPWRCRLRTFLIPRTARRSSRADPSPTLHSRDMSQTWPLLLSCCRWMSSPAASRSPYRACDSHPLRGRRCGLRAHIIKIAHTYLDRDSPSRVVRPDRDLDLLALTWGERITSAPSLVTGPSTATVRFRATPKPTLAIVTTIRSHSPSIRPSGGSKATSRTG